MQLPSLLLQLPAFISNLTNPTVSSSASAAGAASVAAVNNMAYQLPALPYAYNALEPHISEQIMVLHHTKHHQAYVTNLNAALQAHVQALSTGDVKAQIALQQAIKFHGGGHINHSLFWPSLAPGNSSAASLDAAPALVAALAEQYGSPDNFMAEFKKLLLGIQGSGWGWVVKSGKDVLELVAKKDQDPVTGDKQVVFGVDMWEHAYYLQYWNDKAKYVDAVLKIINWEVAEKRFQGTEEPLSV